MRPDSLGEPCAAREAGIAHGDLKPARIFITTGGHVKVLDLGVAKLTELAAGVGGASMSPTLLGTAVGPGTGTAGYMAPEQAEGAAAVDHPADFFAFGTLLAYESDRTGRFEVYVRRLSSGAEIQVFPGGGNRPSWSPDDSELLYRGDGDSRMIAAGIVAAPTRSFSVRASCSTRAPAGWAFWNRATTSRPTPLRSISKLIRETRSTLAAGAARVPTAVNVFSCARPGPLPRP